MSKVACEREDKLLNIHEESETCEVCASLSEATPADTRERLLYDVLEFVQFVRDRHGLVAAETFLKRAEALGITKEERP